MIALTLLVALAGVTGADDSRPPAAMLRHPDVNETHVVFSYAGDLWVVAREGGMASPLSSPAGSEALARFSPDGQTIAFLGNYEGDEDIYTIPAGGGVPRRVTYHPSTELLCDWTPDGHLLFASSENAPLGRILELFAVPAEGGLPTRLPVPYGTNAAVSADGLWLAYTPYSRDSRTWKRYQGGMASDIWLFHLETFESRRITDWPGTDSIPMWHGERIYYVSDAGPEHRINLWQYDVASGQHRQVTRFERDDVRSPAIGPGPEGQGEIVFQLGSSLRLLDLGDETTREIPVWIPGDRAEPYRRSIDVAEQIQAWGISSTGKRAVVEARGDIWTLPAKKGAPRNLTHSDASAERDPAWSPDGRWIAYFGDSTGEYELHVIPSDGSGEPRRLTHAGRAYRSGISWSPDSKHLAFSESDGALVLYSFDSGELKTIDHSPMGGGGIPRWSHDSRWLTYARPTAESMNSRIFLYDRVNDHLEAVTSGMFSDSSPTFDRAGNYLYFASSRSFSPEYSSIDTTFIYPDSELLLAVPLRADVKYPWPAESDEEEWKDEDEASVPADEEADEEADDKPTEPAAETSRDALSGHWDGTLTGGPIPPPGVSVYLDLTLADDGTVTGNAGTPAGDATVKGTFDPARGALVAETTNDQGSHSQIEATVQDDVMNGTARNAQGEFQLTAKRASVAGSEEPGGAAKEDVQAVVEIEIEGFERRAFPLPVPAGSFADLAVNHQGALLYVRGGDNSSVKLFDLKDDARAEKEVAAGGRGFALSADGKKILVARGNRGSIQDASAGASGSAVVTAGMQTTVSPRREWRQILVDAWRMEREFFYDPNMHGVDWDSLLQHYLPMVDHCSSREDLTYVIGELIGELNAGHAYVRPSPEQDTGSKRNVGLLGVDFELHSLAYRIARIHAGAAWDVDARNPLQRGGVDVHEGDYLLAVNGVELDISRSPLAAFVGLADVVVQLTVSARPYIDAEARRVFVTPLASDRSLRYRAWIEANRRHVDEASNGQLGYIYVPDTQQNGQNDLFRQFFGQNHRAGLIIDDRWNGGGQIPTRFVELLNRPATNQWALRTGHRLPWPFDSHQGPKCMLINGLAGSGGDAFPAYFRQARLGKLIGTRTWGGLIGISGGPSLIDGGGVTAPSFAFFENDGTWGIEGHGVEPDIHVVDDPARMVGGGDPQLDAAIAHLLEEVRLHPYVAPPIPPYPDRSGMGIPASDM